MRPRFAEVNGDGLSDLLLVDSSRISTYLSNGNGTFTYKYNTILNRHGADHFADVNGDGLTDIITYYYDRWSYKGLVTTYFSNANGTFAYGGTTRLPGKVRPRFVEVNGDGLSDLLLVDSDSSRISTYLSNGNGTFTYKGYTNLYRQRGTDYFADVNGDGLTDIITYYYNRWSRQGQVYIYFANGNGPPDLATSIDNGNGAKTTIQYTPSSQYNNTFLPFITHPVSMITVDDGLGNLSTTEYSYAGGFYDHPTREFRGFKSVTQTYPDRTILKTKFYQGDPIDPDDNYFFKGRQKWVEFRKPNEGPLLTKTDFTWETYPASPSENFWAFIKLASQREEVYDGAVTAFSQQDNTYDDTNGYLFSMTTSGSDAESVTTNFLYEKFGDWLWRRTRETVENSFGKEVRKSYYHYENGTGNLLFKEFWLDEGGANNPIIRMTYDEYGNQETVTDARGNPTVNEYDSATHTYPVRITYPQTNGVSHVVENEEWDYRFGKPTVTKDENGNRTYYEYDEFGRLTQVDTPDGGQVITEYYDDELPRLVITRSLEDDFGSTIDNYQYVDGLGRQIQTIAFGEGGKSIVTRYYYDEMGRNDLVEGPFFATGDGFPIEPPDPPEGYPWTQTTFEERGRPDTVEKSDGVYGSVATTFSYSGLSTTVTDPDGESKTEKKDYLGRVIQVVEHADDGNYDTNYEYNAVGDLLKVTDYYGNPTIINYDSLGRKLKMTDQDMGIWEYTYDENGNLLTQIDQKPQTITFEYDELNRVVSKSYDTLNPWDPTVDYSYDNLIIKNGRGRLYSVSNTQVTTTYNEYDPMGRVKTVSKTIDGDGTAYTTRRIYDRSGKLKQTTYPDGYQVNNSFYPGTGLLKAVIGSDYERYAYNTDYEPTGKIGLMEHGNETYTRHTYDPESTRLKSIISSRTGPTTDLQNKTYQYTPAGNIKQIADNVKGVSFNYSYDKLHRLKTETNTGSYEPISYSYNAVGNIMSKTVGSTSMDYNYQGPRPHAVKTITFNGTNYDYTYDDNGNMTSGRDFTDPQQVAQRTISYNADNMPRSISHEKSGNNVTTAFVYDGNGVRAKKTVRGGSTTYYVDDHFEIKDGVETKFIFAGNLRVAKITESGINYFHKDHLGSSSVISDNNGKARETSDYMPFGSLRNHTGSNESNYKFTDQELDASTGLYNYDARLYDPVIGRFVTADSIVPDWYDPQLLNRYSYVSNNPLKHTDPVGHEPADPFDIDAGGPGAWGSPPSSIHDPKAQIFDKEDFVFGSVWGVGTGFATGNPGLGVAIGVGGVITSSLSRFFIRDAAKQYVKDRGWDKPSDPEPEDVNAVFTGNSKTVAGGGTGPGGSAENLRGMDYEELIGGIDRSENNKGPQSEGKDTGGGFGGRPELGL